MTRLLVSVRSVDEARAALEGGADIIDVKEPSRGSLGRADDRTIETIIAAVDDRRPVTVALGELTDSPAIAQTNGWWLAKVGFAGSNSWRAGLVSWRAGSISARSTRAGTPGAYASGSPIQLMKSFLSEKQFPAARLALAAYADWQRADAPPPLHVLEIAIELNCAALLIDTWKKDGSGLLEWLELAELGELVGHCRSKGIPIALAGSLRMSDLDRLQSVQPDIVAVRGAVCKGLDRSGAVDGELVRQWANLVHAMPRKSMALTDGMRSANLGKLGST